MEGSLEFFRSEFTNKMDSEKFTKQYAYNIRHMYGQEGSRIEAKPLSCATIILGNAPTASDCHGCPFRHTEVAILKKKLESFGQFREDQITEMLTLSKMNRFDKVIIMWQ
jgi:DNA primase large subunit